MKRTLKLILLIAVSGIAASTHAALIDFDNLAGGGVLSSGSVLTNQYTSLGVNFQAFESGTPQSSIVVTDVDSIDGNYWANVPDVGFGDPRFDLLQIVFAQEVNLVSFLINSFGDPSPQLLSFQAYDSNNTLLEILTVGNSVWGTATFSASGISRIDAIQPDDAWVWGLDNLSFETQAVPEPPIALLFSFGIGLLILVKRKLNLE